MARTIRARELLCRADTLYEAVCAVARPPADALWRGQFSAGGRWMQLALACLRGEASSAPVAGLNRLGVIKYGLAGSAALAMTAISLRVGAWAAVLLGVLVFYAVESQMVFLFPLWIDGTAHPFRESRRWTRRAGGVAVMGVVMQLALVMVAGGFLGKGFVRSWCLGCLAVCIWYEDLREAEPARVVDSIA